MLFVGEDLVLDRLPFCGSQLIFVEAHAKSINIQHSTEQTRYCRAVKNRRSACGFQSFIYMVLHIEYCSAELASIVIVLQVPA